MKVWNKRDAGIPVGAVYVGRPTRWGNPYQIGPHGSRQDVLRKYRAYIMTDARLREEARRALKGKDLVCWCAPQACHADILMEVANS